MLQRVLIIRHAESEGNVTQTIPGRVDYSLTAAGEAQAHALGQVLAQKSWTPAQIYSSPLRRSRQTAEILRSYQSLHPSADRSGSPHRPLPPILLDDRLQEIDNGILSGLTWTEAQARYPDLCQALETSPQWLPVPQAESPLECRQRAEAFVAEVQRSILQDQPDSKYDSDPQGYWWISHGGFIPYLFSVLLGSDRTWGFHLPPAGCIELSWVNLPEDALNLEQPLQQQWQQERHNPTRWQIHHFLDSL